MKILLLLTLIFASVGNASNYDNALSQIEKISHDHERQNAFIYFYEHSFKPYLGKKNLKSIKKDELKEIIHVFETITFYIQDKNIITDYQTYFRLLEKNNWAVSKNYRNLYAAFIKNRMFAKANLFYENHPNQNLNKLPKIIDDNSTDGRIVIYTTDGKNKNILTKKKLALPKDLSIIVLAHPFCHFCQRAAKHLSSNQPLSTFLKENSTWIAPIDGNVRSDILFDWHKTYPNFSISYIQYMADFPMLDYWGTPSFYFVKDGKVLDKLVGWPDIKRMHDLQELIKKHFAQTF